MRDDQKNTDELLKTAFNDIGKTNHLINGTKEELLDKITVVEKYKDKILKT